MDNVVVGTDGSKNGRAALQWAFDYARVHGATVRAVTVWEYPYAAAEAVTIAVPGRNLFEEAAAALLDDELAHVQADGVTVERVVREGQPASVLLDEATSAVLLVVGSRGHGGFAGLLLGSVATQCIRHPKVTTVVVPPEQGVQTDGKDSER